MKKTRLFALALAGMMAFGSATPAFAEGTGTPVGFTLAEPCVAYTMTIPTGNTSIATDGTFSSIGNLTITKESGKDDFDSKHKVVVTVTRGTEMVKTGSESSATTAITYDLYTTSKADDNKVANGGTIEFSATDINETGGKSVAMGVAISGSNFNSLEPGDYRDTITFAAKAVDAAAATMTKEQVISLVDVVWSKLKNGDGKTPSDDGRGNSFRENVGSFAFAVGEDGTYIFTNDEEGIEFQITIADGKVTVKRDNSAKVITYTASIPVTITLAGVSITATDGEQWYDIMDRYSEEIYEYLNREGDTFVCVGGSSNCIKKDGVFVAGGEEKFDATATYTVGPISGS